MPNHSLYPILMHMNAIGRDFKSFQTQILAEIDKEFSHIFDSGLNLLHKNPILKNSKKTLHHIARPIALQNS